MKQNKKQIENGVNEILVGLGLTMDEHLKETPKRVAEMFLYHYRGLLEIDAALAMLDVGFTSPHTGSIALRGITGNSLCPHHLMPITYTADLIYIPNKRVVGSSKPYRAFAIFAAQPLMQEDVTELFANEFYNRVKPKSCVFTVIGRFFCMEKDGINSHTATMTTVVKRGKEISTDEL